MLVHPISIAPRARANLEGLLSTEEFAQAREQHNLPAQLDSTSIRLLTDAQDRTVCEVLAQRVASDPYISRAPWKSVFYQAGDWYFVVNLKYPLEQYQSRIVDNKLTWVHYYVPVDSYDANLHHIGGWGL